MEDATESKDATAEDKKEDVPMENAEQKIVM